MERRDFLRKFVPKNPSLNSRIPDENAENSRILDEKKLQINVSKCVAWNGVVCSSCADVCHAKAIKFFGLFRPVINENCDNCNDCITSCFKGAIDVC